MALSKKEIEAILADWLDSWNRHDLEAVMELFHEDIVFENWNGDSVRGKRSLRAAWKDWFENHGGFEFEPLGTLIDEETQEALLRWRLNWPSQEKDYRDLPEVREGLDILRFRNGLIDLKSTYTKTVVEIDGKKMRMGL